MVRLNAIEYFRPRLTALSYQLTVSMPLCAWHRCIKRWEHRAGITSQKHLGRQKRCLRANTHTYSSSWHETNLLHAHKHIMHRYAHSDLQINVVFNQVEQWLLVLDYVSLRWIHKQQGKETHTGRCVNSPHSVSKPARLMSANMVVLICSSHQTPCCNGNDMQWKNNRQGFLMLFI